ncbi:MAG: hypothetical protein AAF725_19290 [Acidobacteriota bacterium]
MGEATETPAESIDTLLIERDDPETLLLRQPALAAPLIGAAVGLALAAVSRIFFEGHHVAAALFFALALWSLSGALKSHQLRLDFAAHRWSYRRGWRFGPPVEGGAFEELESLAIEAHSARDGLISSRLRGHALWLLTPAGRRIRLGTPMGPLVAEERAEELSRRLGIPLRGRGAASS